MLAECAFPKYSTPISRLCGIKNYDDEEGRVPPRHWGHRHRVHRLQEAGVAATHLPDWNQRAGTEVLLQRAA